MSSINSINIITLILLIIQIKTAIQIIENNQESEENINLNQRPSLHINFANNPNNAMFDPFENIAQEMMRII